MRDWGHYEVGPLGGWPQSGSPLGPHQQTLTCLLPVSPATFCPFSGLLETLLFTSGDGRSLGSLVPPFVPQV